MLLTCMESSSWRIWNTEEALLTTELCGELTSGREEADVRSDKMKMQRMQRRIMTSRSFSSFYDGK